MSADALRIDRWLWCARFFKTRSLAVEEVKAGHVRIDGQRIKPAHDVRVGDTLTIHKAESVIELVVAGIPLRRGSASVAAAHYLESKESVERRTADAAERARTPRVQPPTHGRPDKRTRRLIRDHRRSD
jgi:ribosome-associated heat shock protein Hsp15